MDLRQMLARVCMPLLCLTIVFLAVALARRPMSHELNPRPVQRESAVRDYNKHLDSSMNGEDMRSALIRFADSYGEPLNQSVSLLKTVKPEIMRGVIKFGPWECHVAERRFNVVLISDPLILEVEGEFSREHSGQLVARAIRERRN